MQRVVVWHEDAPDLQDEGDFERDDDEGVDGDGYMKELSDVSFTNGSSSTRSTEYTISEV